MSPEVLFAIATTVATGLGFAVSELRHVRVERRRAKEREKGIERRETNVRVELNEHLEGLVQDRIDAADARIEQTLIRNLRGLCGSVDSRLATFERTLKSMSSTLVGAMDERRKDLASLSETEKQNLREKVELKRAILDMNEVGRRLLEVLDPPK